MKTNIIVSIMAACGVALFVISQLNRAQAQARPKSSPEVILVGLKATMSDYFVTNTYGQNKIQLGMEVDWQSASIGAASVPTNYPAGQAFAYWLSLGYTWKQVGVNQYVFEKL